jgi:predicted amidohydrolase YtcJ
MSEVSSSLRKCSPANLNMMTLTCLCRIAFLRCHRDGALGSWGAAMLEPYSDRPEETGIMVTPEEAWTGLIDDFVRNVSLVGRFRV